MNYCSTDFLEFFDVEKIIDQQAGMVEYSVQSKDNISLVVSMDTYDDKVYFKMTSELNVNLINFYLNDIDTIVCHRNGVKVRFLFYKHGKSVPIVCLYIRPSWSLLLDIEHEEDVNDYPYRSQNS